MKKQCNQGSAQVKEEPSGGQRRRPPLEPFAPSGLQAQDLEKHIPVRGRKLLYLVLYSQMSDTFRKTYPRKGTET